MNTKHLIAFLEHIVPICSSLPVIAQSELSLPNVQTIQEERRAQEFWKAFAAFRTGGRSLKSLPSAQRRSTPLNLF